MGCVTDWLTGRMIHEELGVVKFVIWTVVVVGTSAALGLSCAIGAMYMI